jgi:hypothetical protein
LAVIATSEVGRGFYRSNDPRERTTDLASGKESSGIEYGADLLLVLRNVHGSAFGVDVTMPKNRMGAKTPFRLRFDVERASFCEVALDDKVEAAMQDAEFHRKRDALRRAVLDAVRANPSLKSKTALASVVKGRKGDVLAMLDVLIAEGAIAKGAVGFCISEGKEATP